MYDHVPGKRLAHSRPHSFLVEYQRDLPFGVLIKEAIDFSDYGSVCLSKLRGTQRWWHGKTARGATFEAHVHRDLVAFDQSDVLEDQPDHTLPLAIRCLWVLPQPGKITGQSCDSSPLCFTDRGMVGLALPIILLLSFLQCAQLVVPLGLQGTCNQAIGGVDVHIAALGQIILIASALHLLPA